MNVYRPNRLKGPFLALLLLAFMVGTAGAATYDLCAGETSITITMPDGITQVPMWGFTTGGPDGQGGCNFSTDPNYSYVPPELTVPSNGGLTINLTNTLPEPVSLHIIGQALTPNGGPVFTTDPSGLQRVMSFSHETPAGGGPVTYTWSNFKPGTYMLQSGTNPAKQVQMGLYAAVIKDYPGMTYNKQFTMVFHDVDPDIHAAIDAGDYGYPGAIIPSSAHREPRYFLINGKAYPDILNPIFEANIGDQVLLRCVNAGLVTHVPTMLGMYMTTVAEDGIPYTYTKQQYGFEMAAAKTMDAIIEPTAVGSFPIYDGILMLSNKGTYKPTAPGDPAGGGMLAYLKVDPAAGAPIANDDAYTVNEDTLTPLEVAAPGVLGNDTGPGGGADPLPDDTTAVLVSGVSNGTLSLLDDGSFTYTPNPNFSGTDSFTYKAQKGVPESNVATVTITVTPVNDPPIADPNGPYTASVNVPVTLDGTGSSDVDGDTLTYDWTFGDTNTGTGATPTHTYTSGGTYTVELTVDDGTGVDTAATTVEVAVAVNQLPVAVDDYPTVVRNSVGNLINVVQNDYDPDGTIDTTTVTIIDQPANGTVDNVSPAGVVTYTPNAKFKGTDVFTYRVQDNDGDFSWRETATGPTDEATRVFVNVVIKR